MKRFFLLVSLFALSLSTVFAQNKMAYDRYTVSGGLLGALNFSKLRLNDDASRDIDYDFKPGWSAGLWLSLPLGESAALEPQLLYSKYQYETAASNPFFQYGHLSYFTVPVLLKLYHRNTVALTVGPQFDFLVNLDDGPLNITKDDFESTSISLSAGLEILPRGPVTPFVRYIYGFTNVNALANDEDIDYFNSSWQVGIKVKLFGDFIPADSDADGIRDTEDNCPLLAGSAALQGCPDTDNDGIIDPNDNCVEVAGVARYNGCPIPDTDSDGINDEVDKCPKQAGVAKYNGCPIPDTDGDGVNDDEDKCPSKAGIAKYMGCPIPDTDGDGINDENDKCPSVVGTAQFNGCPNPDRDNDGVLDADDLCPTIKGPKDNDGCPVVESAVFNAKMINFVTGKAELTPQAKRDLKEGAKLLNSPDFKNLKVEIQGHTDNVGSAESNHTLSHKRADAVKAELVKDGVSADRLTTIGFGEDKPIADNSTSAGRALNRRVVLKARE